MKTKFINIKINTLLLLTGSILLSLLACKKKTTPPNPNEEELITTFRLDLTDSAGLEPAVSLLFRDPDGEGGNAPIQWDTLKLSANTTYLGTILLLDESKSPADTISHEVADEADEHLFCFTPTGIQCVVQRLDLDVNGLETGLSTKWRTGAVGSGKVQIELRHQPDTKDGTCTPGSSDLDITFEAMIN